MIVDCLVCALHVSLYHPRIELYPADRAADVRGAIRGDEKEPCGMRTKPIVSQCLFVGADKERYVHLLGQFDVRTGPVGTLYGVCHAAYTHLRKSRYYRYIYIQSVGFIGTANARTRFIPPNRDTTDFSFRELNVDCFLAEFRKHSHFRLYIFCAIRNGIRTVTTASRKKRDVQLN